MSKEIIKDTLSKEELELIGYKNIGGIDDFISTKWNMKVQGFWADNEYGRATKYYISMIELHARLSMIVDYNTYNGIKPVKMVKPCYYRSRHNG